MKVKKSQNNVFIIKQINYTRKYGPISKINLNIIALYEFISKDDDWIISLLKL